MTVKDMNIMSSKANDIQVGGDHYRTEYQHWDFVSDMGWQGYLKGCATKYISRWKKKNGVEDLKKALHYIQKLLEIPTTVEDEYDEELVEKFVEHNKLSHEDALCVKLVCIGDYPSLRLAGSIIEYQIENHKK